MSKNLGLEDNSRVQVIMAMVSAFDQVVAPSKVVQLWGFDQFEVTVLNWDTIQVEIDPLREEIANRLTDQANLLMVSTKG